VTPRTQFQRVKGSLAPTVPNPI